MADPPRDQTAPAGDINLPITYEDVALVYAIVQGPEDYVGRLAVADLVEGLGHAEEAAAIRGKGRWIFTARRLAWMPQPPLKKLIVLGEMPRRTLPWCYECKCRRHDSAARGALWFCNRCLHIDVLRLW